VSPRFPYPTRTPMKMNLPLAANIPFATALLCGLLVTTGLSNSALADTITLKDGKTETGKVKAEEFGGVTFDPSKGDDKLILWKDIAANGITYEGAEEYMAAKELFDQNRFDDAIAAFAEVAKDGKKGVLRQNALYYSGKAQAMSGKFDAALASFEALTKDYGKSRWLMDIGETMVSIYAAKKDLANAAKSLDKLGSDASAAGVDASFDKAVQVLKGRVFEEQKDYAKARAAYGVASSASGLDARIVQLGKLGEARCTAATGDKTKAEGIFRSLVREDATNGVLAGAWNGLGDLMLEDGKKGKGDAEKITDALYCYLRGVVQYPPLPGDSTLEHERAIAGAAQCFRFLSQIDSKAEGKRANKDRADQHVAMLRQRYPNSAFLQGL